jgi:hypothetical protein
MLYVRTVAGPCRTFYVVRTYRSGAVPAQAVSRRSLTGSIPGQSIWFVVDKVAMGQVFVPEYFGFPLSISVHRCSITRKNEKKSSSSQGLHNTPQDCGASVESAAGPFTIYIYIYGKYGRLILMLGFTSDCTHRAQM